MGGDVLTVGPEAYRLQFFLENGFQRKECKCCKRHFWTLDLERELCGDSPCVPYSFINDPPTKRKYTIKEMREAFLSFFERRGHTRVRRYPVIARWRDDIFLTIASIACFQPHVTSGEVPPPFNPLTISQPCIRMNDLDNVGKTGGRHLSIFEMMAHHAFSSKDKEVYWKEDTVRYHHELLTEDLGMDEKEIAYIEHWWEGGGDAGPDLEGIVRGLELSTLVFMQYKKVGNEYRDLPLRIVDTGYGLERFTWVSQGTPTAFEAIYGRLFNDFIKLSKIGKPDAKVMAESTRLAGMMNVVDEGSLKSARKHVADLLGMDAESLEHQLEPVETVMAILDHTKTLAFMFSDGVVPSNVQAGYLARLIVRRVKRMMESIGMETPLSELLSIQISYWRDQFPDLAESVDYVTKVADLEVSRYIKTIEQGKSLVLRIIKEEGISKAGALPLDRLIELYDSNGLPPEIVKEVSEAQGVKVEIPDTFDTIVAERHSASSPSADAKTAQKDILEGIPALPATILAYYSDPKAQRLKAKVLYSDERRIVLDRTIFYPEGGGQLSDSGKIMGEGKEANVMEAQKSRNIVVHFVKGGVSFRAGEEVECVVDWQRRMSLARHHSSTHILLGAARRVLGEHVWQEGAQKSVDRSRLDISHFEKVTPDQLREIETIANRIVQECRPIKTYFEERNKAEQRFGVRLYQGGVVYGSTIRVVEIDGWDVEACGGIHCANTGEIGLIKIMKSERIQDGVERLEFASGEPALRFVQSKESDLQEISNIVNSPVERIVQAVAKQKDELLNARKEIEHQSNQIGDIFHKKEPDGFITLPNKIEFPLEFKKANLSDTSTLRVASRIVAQEPEGVVVVTSGATGAMVVMAGTEAIAQGANSGEIARLFTEALDGKGGGKVDVGQGRVPLDALKATPDGILKRIGERVKGIKLRKYQKK